MDDIPHYERIYLAESQSYPHSQLLQLLDSGSSYRPVVERVVIRRFDSRQGPTPPRRIRLAYFRIVTVLEGNISLHIGGRVESFPQGSLFIWPPGLQPSSRPQLPSTCLLGLICFGWIDSRHRHLHMSVDMLFREISLPWNRPIPEGYRPLRLLPPILLKELQELHHRFIACAEGRGDGKDQLPLLLFDLLRLVQGRGDGAARQHEGSSEIGRAKKIIEEGYRSPLNIRELAESLHLSRSQFQRKYKKNFGISPIEYRNMLRIQAAKSLLLLTDNSCREISSETGFSDEYYFSKIFKKFTGLSPGRYRAKKSEI